MTTTCTVYQSICNHYPRTIYDFSPEQQKNLSAIVWLYRGQSQRFISLVAEHLERMNVEATRAVSSVRSFSSIFADATADRDSERISDDLLKDFEELKFEGEKLDVNLNRYEKAVAGSLDTWRSSNRENDSLIEFAAKAEPFVALGQDLSQELNRLSKLLSRTYRATTGTGRRSLLNTLQQTKKEAVEKLGLPHYFWTQARWLQERFPEAVYQDVEGLVKLADLGEIEDNDWSLTPGRYVGVAPDEEDENFSFEDTIREIHVELLELNSEAAGLAKRIAQNFEALVG